MLAYVVCHTAACTTCITPYTKYIRYKIVIAIQTRSYFMGDVLLQLFYVNNSQCLRHYIIHCLLNASISKKRHKKCVCVCVCAYIVFIFTSRVSQSKTDFFNSRSHFVIFIEYSFLSFSKEEEKRKTNLGLFVEFLYE